MSEKWSENSMQLTREAIKEYFVAPDGLLHMKNIANAYGAIKLEDLLESHYLIVDKATHAEYSFGSIDELITAGWVVD